MKVSIITATYNSSETILTTLKSVVDQTYDNIEHIFIDGMSSDDTIEKIKKFAICNYVIRSESDSGIYEALNKGIAMASGDIIGFLHSDDFFSDENCVQKIVDTIKDTNSTAVYSDLVYVDRNDTSIVLRYWKSGLYNKGKIINGWMPPHPTVFIRKSVIDNYFFNLEYLISADYDVLLRLFSNDKNFISYIPSVLVHMRVGGISNRSLANIILKTKEDYKVIKANKIGGVLTVVMKNLRKLSQFSVVGAFKR